MSGLSVFNLSGLVFFLTLLGSSAFSQATQTETVLVKNEGARLYRQADFDSPLIMQLKQGQKIIISKKLQGAFFKAKVQNGVFGYIADTDVVLKKNSTTKKTEKAKSSLKKKKAEEKISRRVPAIDRARFRGFQVSQQNWTEDSMGARRVENMTFYGLKFSGPDVVLEGVPTDANILFSFSPPNYYREVTGKSATGFVLTLNFLLQMGLPKGKDFLLFYGLGPQLKISKFDVAWDVNGQEEPYSLTDAVLGAVFNLGFTYRIESVALRGEMLYNWDKFQSTGFTLAVQMPF